MAAFLQWVLTNECNPARVTRVALTPAGNDQGYQELPIPPDDVRYDPLDRVFLAVAAAHFEHPPVLQALDSRWWGRQKALEGAGVTTELVCAGEIERRRSSTCQGDHRAYDLI